MYEIAHVLTFNVKSSLLMDSVDINAMKGILACLLSVSSLPKAFNVINFQLRVGCHVNDS